MGGGLVSVSMDLESEGKGGLRGPRCIHTPKGLISGT